MKLMKVQYVILFIQHLDLVVGHRIAFYMAGNILDLFYVVSLEIAAIDPVFIEDGTGIEIDIVIAYVLDLNPPRPDTVHVMLTKGITAPITEIAGQLVIIIRKIGIAAVVEAACGGHVWEIQVVPRAFVNGTQFFRTLSLVKGCISRFQHDGGCVIGGAVARDVAVGFGDGIERFGFLLAFQLILVLPAAGAGGKRGNKEECGQGDE